MLRFPALGPFAVLRRTAAWPLLLCLPAVLAVCGCSTGQGAASTTGGGTASSAPGPAGPPGIVFEGPYAATTQYNTTDVVTFGGSSYFATASSQGVLPVGAPASAVSWSLLAAAGTEGPAGPAGAAGPQGAAGPMGLTGSQGPAGLTGSAGPAGPVGLQGVAGPAGTQGLPGLTGLQGAPGLPGADGLPGAAGLPGVQGQIGVAGPTGPTGPAGPQGQAGVVSNATVMSAWNGKTMVAFGDSIFTFPIPSAVASAEGLTLKFADAQGGRPVNAIFSHYPGGHSDGTFTPQGDTLAQDLAGVDVVVIELSTNDYLTEPLGSYSDAAGTVSLAGYIRTAVEAVLAANPLSRVIWVAPYHMLGRWPGGTLFALRDLTVQVCGDYGVPVIDQGLNGMMAPVGSAPGNLLTLETDGIHPSATAITGYIVPYLARQMNLYGPVVVGTGTAAAASQ